MQSFNAFSKHDVRPRKLATLEEDNEIVISGIAGRFPESNNVAELYENLINKVDMVTDDNRRWKYDHPDVPKRSGKLYDIDKFDALFFGIHHKQVQTMNPIGRILLEQTYEAIIDAGINPQQIRGSKTGVFIGTSFSDYQSSCLNDEHKFDGFDIIGSARALLANRISHWLDVTGPSYSIDTGCSSSLFALEHGYRAIADGRCDAAIVGAGNLCLDPLVSMQYFKFGVLSKDGRCKTFDESADGFVRSEAISVVFLQKRKDAKRIYATVVHGKVNCDGYKERGISFPSSLMQSILFKEIYMECCVPPTAVDYIEAHGTGTLVGDLVEMTAIDKVFNAGRTMPLKVGSIKSNMGHAESAAGICSLIKIILAMESGIIPPNLHYKNPRKALKCLTDGTISIATEPTPWNGGYAAINSFGIGGANAHILLRSNPKEKINNGAPKDKLSRLVPLSGRTEEAVTNMINYLNSSPVDVEYIGLLHNIHSANIKGHPYRGYTILPPTKTAENTIKEIVQYSDNGRPVWFVYSGMGSEWLGMGETLLQIPIFRQAIEKCDAVLKPHGIDIFDIITNKEIAVFDNILNAFVGISACQIGLTDILRAINIEPDHIIGHSFGELGCAYADGCLTAEQTILASYSRGKISIECQFIHGSLAVIGLGYKDVKNLCPPDIEVACHNSNKNSTISGPTESVKAFIAELRAKNIFAKEIQCNNIPYHSRYIASARPKYLAYLQEIISDPKIRSPKWVSTSVPMDKWETRSACYSSAEYHTNNLLSPVLFEETSALIQENAIVIEIAPHGLLQAILRRSLPLGVTNIPLMQRDHANNVEFILSSIGKMYTIGLQPQIANIYEPIQFPVSRTTPMISPLIKWNHIDKWHVPSFQNQQNGSCFQYEIKISRSELKSEHLDGHVIDGRIVFPASGYLSLVWKALGLMKGKNYSDISVVFEDLKFLRFTTILDKGDINFTVIILKGTNRFEVMENEITIVTGLVYETNNPASEKLIPSTNIDGDENQVITSRDVYKELKLRGYQYSDVYRGIVTATVDGLNGRIKWNDNWISFIDTMLQLYIFSHDTRNLFVPISIKKVVIDTIDHYSQIQLGETTTVFPAHVDKNFDSVVCGSVEIYGIKIKASGRRKSPEPILEEYKFVPYVDSNEVSLKELVRLSTQICLENHIYDKNIVSVELIETSDSVPADNLLSPLIVESLRDMPLIQANINIVCNEKYNDLESNIVQAELNELGTFSNVLLAIGHCLLTENRIKNLNALLSLIKDNGFLLTREATTQWSNFEKIAQSKDLDIIFSKKHGNESFLLLKKRQTNIKNISIVYVDNNNFDWIEKMKKVMSEVSEKESNKWNRVIFVGQGDFENGLTGLINCLRKEPGGASVRGILIQDPKATKFSLDNPLYAKQLEKDLVISVLRENGVWGSYRHIPLPPLTPKNVQHAIGNNKIRGDLTSLGWIEGPLRRHYKCKNLISICYSAINFKDVMLATGKLDIESTTADRLMQENVLGGEYSGVDESGKRIMGLVISQAISNLIIGDPTVSWEVPQDWSLEDAATVPCVYATCCYAFYKYGNLRKGEKVLIHAGSGGVGQAAINLALHEGCEVFTTVGTARKRKFIRDTFPQIPEDHIGNSRDTSFVKMIINLTNGQGVDIVLNSLSGDKLQASLACLAEGGRFLEIGRVDLVANNKLGMEIFLKKIRFYAVQLEAVITGTAVEKAELKSILDEKLKAGAIKPLIRTVFPKEEIEAAFRYLAGDQHIGKVLLKIRNDKEPFYSPIEALPRYNCYKDRSYIILGGLGGFGLELADWLILRGARNLVLTSRKGITNGYQKMRINLWQNYGARVVVVVGKEASKLEDCNYILKVGMELGPVDGVFNLAVNLKDAIWQNQTADTFEELFKSKAWATKNLDVLTRKTCPQLRHFVVFSSASCGRGNIGQTNYGMSNSAMERICERRYAEGLPALAIQWGPIGDVGVVAELEEDHKKISKNLAGILQQSIKSCLQKLNEFMVQNRPIVSSLVVAEKVAADTTKARTVIDAVLSTLNLKDWKRLNPETPLAEFGVDSMTSTEINQILKHEFEIFLTDKEILNLNLSKLQKMNAIAKCENNN